MAGRSRGMVRVSEPHAQVQLRCWEACVLVGEHLWTSCPASPLLFDLAFERTVRICCERMTEREEIPRNC